MTSTLLSSQTRTDWWRSAVIYQIYPWSFKDSSGDGIGDLPGVLQQLDYVASLGVDAIWLSPFFKSPMRDFGYDISDYCAVDPRFGTLSDFKDILQAAHERNMKVLIDQVWNHTSNQHPWFQTSRTSRSNSKADWYVWADPKPDGSPPNNWLSTFGGSAWAWEPQRQQYYLHNFLVEQPDLNWYNPEVIDAILEVARFWLDLGVDGFRLDVVNFFTHNPNLKDNPLRPADMPRPAGASHSDPFFSQINLYNFCQPATVKRLRAIRQLMDAYPGTTTLAEISSAEDAVATSSEYVGSGRLHMAYNSSLMIDQPLSQPHLREIIQRVEATMGDGVICWTGGTHDFPRIKSRWGKYHPSDQFIHQAFDHMFAALVVALRGSCCIYQGDELGLTQAHVPYEKMKDPFGLQGYPSVLGRDGSRTPMPWQKDLPHGGFTTAHEPWLPVPTEHLPLAVAEQSADPDSLLNRYRQLIQWRRQQPAFKGDLTLLDTPEPVLGFLRSGQGQRLMCLFNISPETCYHTLPQTPHWHGVDALDLAYRRYDNTVELPPYGVFFAVAD